MLRRILVGVLVLYFSEFSQAQTPQLAYVPRSFKDTVTSQLGIRTDTIYNRVLWETAIDWMGTRYRYGGKTKAGIDCSDFTCMLYKQSYNIELSGSASDIFKKTTPIEKSELKEGDMVFFKIHKRRISHVGVYLGDNKFAHATTRAGVVISDLNEPYYLRYWYKGGVVNNKTNSTILSSLNSASNTESSPDAAFFAAKYSKLFRFKIDSIGNPKLYESIKNILQKPVSKKSKKKKDRDGFLFCSAVYAQTYNMKLGENTAALLKTAQPLSKDELQEGDLVFFKSKKKTSKIGIYLAKNKFVHLSSGKSVTVNDLNEPAFRKTYYRGGRITNK